MTIGKKEVLMVSYLDYPYAAGLSARIDGLVGVLAQNGIKVSILAPIARAAPDRRNFNNCLVEYTDLRRFGFRNSNQDRSRVLQWLLFSVIASFKVAKRYVKRHPLIQFQSAYSVIPALFAKILGAKILGDDIILVHPLIDVPVFRLSDAVSTASSIAYSFGRRLRRRTLYIPNGVMRSSFSRATSDSSSQILFVGSLSFDQNLRATENIIRVASNLKKKGFEFQIIVAGGPLSYADDLIDDPIVREGRVRFPGMVSKESLMRLYHDSYIGLLPFFEDTPLIGGQRTKALEFFAHRLLVISGPEGAKGISGLQPGKHYLLVNSIDEMSEVIGKCLSNPKQYEEIVEAGSRHILENFSWEAVSKNYIKLIRGLTTQAPSPAGRKYVR